MALSFCIDQGLVGSGVLWNDAGNRPAGRVAGIESYGLIGIFHRDEIGNLTVDVLFVEVGNPIVFVIFVNDCQEPRGQLIGKDVVYRWALLAFVGAIGGFDQAEAEDQQKEEKCCFHKNICFLRIYRLCAINAGGGPSVYPGRFFP